MNDSISLMDDKECPMCENKNYDKIKGCKDCGFVGLCLSDKEYFFLFSQ